MTKRESLQNTRRWVVKIGSALITANGKGLDRDSLRHWVDQIADLIEAGNEVVVVSSGAVAEGMKRMAWAERPTSLHGLQAAAAIGQMGLVQAWESCFKRRGLHTAQVLLTHDDLSNRKRYLNARGTLRALVGFGVVPVVNENDAVANEELRFGDNDTLAALVANLIEADLLVLLTDQQGLYDADPRGNPDASLVSHARAGDSALEGMAGGGSRFGQGGMQTKLRAARLAARLFPYVTVHHAGRIAAGTLSDRIGRKTTLFTCFAIQAVLIILLSLTSEGSFLAQPVVLALLSALIGASYGANLALFPSITKDYYGLKNFGVNYGLVFTAWGLGGFMLALLAGRVYDQTQAFTFAYYCSAALLVAAALVTFLVRPPQLAESSLPINRPTVTAAPGSPVRAPAGTP